MNPNHDLIAWRRTSTATFIALACLGGLLLIVAFVPIPDRGKVRGPTPRTPDASHLRQIGQSALIWASDHNDLLPPVSLALNGQQDDYTAATIFSVAAALARDGFLDDSSVWFSQIDQARRTPDRRSKEILPVLKSDRTGFDPTFEREQVFSWDFATGLTTSLPTSTPVAWTRGLRSDGTWNPAGGVYGSDGGHIVFLGGNVAFFHDLKSMPLRRPDGTPTSNILETLPTSARVVGSGPGTLHGSRGLAAP